MIEETVHLEKIAYGRSGDKGSCANIALFAYSKEGYLFLEKALTEEKVCAFFSPLGVKQVTRYALPNLLGFNFYLEDVLGTTASASLRSDAQGKALAQALLHMTLQIPEEILGKCQAPC